nr:S-formylglutathione hydrolase [Legionella massiliensis]
MTLELIEEHSCFAGKQFVYAHQSSLTKSRMRFALFLPPQAEKQKVPVLYWLSGLTSNEQNFITKAGAQRVAAELGLAILCPDTSPRDIELPGDRDSYDFGIGAGFYLDAMRQPWSDYYQMASYVTEELTQLVLQKFPLDGQRMGIFGHSMGGHGALTLALKNPEIFKSLSTFSPICSLMHSPWGQKSLSGYLGEDKALWKNYDACELVLQRGWSHSTILIDQGSADPFLNEQLKPDLFKAACEQAGVDLKLRLHEGYDHSYYFIASFIEEHLRFHERML